MICDGVIMRCFSFSMMIPSTPSLIFSEISSKLSGEGLPERLADVLISGFLSPLINLMQVGSVVILIPTEPSSATAEGAMFFACG